MLRFLLTLWTLAATYAGWLNTKPGRRFARDRTAESVVIGTSLVLLVLRFLIPERAWWTVAAAFGVAGTPLVARSLFNRLLLRR